MALPALDAARVVFLALAGLAAGLANGVAGGGSLFSFPALLAVGYPALTANVTSTVGIWPGYVGGSAGFASEIGEQTRRLRELAPTVVAGGIAGGVLLLTTPSSDFSTAVPYFVLLASILFGLQPLLARRLRVVDSEHRSHMHRFALHGGTFLAAVYGAYFGAGLGVILLGVLGLCIPDRLVRTNGLRAALGLIVNTVAALIFVARAPVAWDAAGIMAVMSLAGGYFGARFSRRVPAQLLRAIVVCLGIATAIVLFLR